ncbi:DNA-methyltransferase [Cohnella lupini]|uniref:Methyltransferase n=1 Tax=Cohnella lupini TaxID=1294267 RepID=A0A3D9ISF2_9BACL|nr:site-specific DNA-methyltransferase [Cohnella lupini]RED64587.1 site-specific DNA-methyltransferase (adenine-specific) [Cohnella lupini]
MDNEKKRAARNRTVTLTDAERTTYRGRLLSLSSKADPEAVLNRTINQDLFEAIDYLPDEFVDLLFVDPPYNLTKTFNGKTFNQMNNQRYIEWLDSWFSRIVRILKPDATVYLCGDWRSGHAIFEVASRYLNVINRITWEREKGRGALANWKNASEDIWHCTKSGDYKFYVDRVKVKRKVIAPYRTEDGTPKDWNDDADGKFRLTHPSNVWTDLTVPFWSMPENTDHPTQKPEKLMAKIILASSDENDVVFDPFGGAGTTSVVAKKLNRRYVTVEIDETYCCLTEKRLELADGDAGIQGYSEGVFWDRNTRSEQAKTRRPMES